MQDSSLRDDLLAIPGVEGAEVEGTDDRPAGLRIRIAEGADQSAVGTAIRRVLTSHGLGTDTRLPGEPTPGAADAGPQGPAVPDEPAGEEPAPPPDTAAERREAPVAASTSVALADQPTAAGAPETEAEPAPVIDLTDRTLEDVRDDGPSPIVPPEAVDPDTPDPGESPEAAPEESIDAEPPSAAPRDPVAEWRLASVAVEEGRAGVLVRVATASGAMVEQHAASSEGGVESAVVRATAQLASPGAPVPTVVEIDDRRTEGADIVTIVLDVDGKLHAGSAVVVAGRSFALGRATWAALSL